MRSLSDVALKNRNGVEVGAQRGGSTGGAGLN